jgi:hypothetical protein
MRSDVLIAAPFFFDSARAAFGFAAASDVPSWRLSSLSVHTPTAFLLRGGLHQFVISSG